MSENHIYYRTLTLEYTEDNWIKGFYHSYHHWVPNEWCKIWGKTHSTDPNVYPLNISDGIFTKNAVSFFIENVQKFGILEGWPTEILDGMSFELAGVCAYDNPKETYINGRESPLAKNNMDRYVVFEGRYLDKIPESFGGGGALVEVIKRLDGPMTRNDFWEKYCK